MTYELAKKLKAVGFLQKGNGWYLSRSGKCLKNSAKSWGMDNVARKYPYRPTLEELIEACGDNFRELYKSDMDGGKEWFATSTDFQAYIGSTPSEAVANLWLELNKNASTHKTL